jgi:hypothetical protein
MSFNQFLHLMHRLSVVYFDINYKAGASLNTVPSHKKLLSLLSRVELTPGFAEFQGALRVRHKQA